MIPIEKIDEQNNFPLKIEPKVEGKFKWCGTKTLQFHLKYKLPLSTIYKIAIEKGKKIKN